MISDIEKQVDLVNIELESYKTEVEDRKHARETLNTIGHQRLLYFGTHIIWGFV